MLPQAVELQQALVVEEQTEMEPLKAQEVVKEPLKAQEVVKGPLKAQQVVKEPLKAQEEWVLKAQEMIWVPWVLIILVKVVLV